MSALCTVNTPLMPGVTQDVEQKVPGQVGSGWVPISLVISVKKVPCWLASDISPLSIRVHVHGEAVWRGSTVHR